MDASDCDPVMLNNTYRQFDSVNRLLSGWRRVYRKRIRPLLKAGRTSVLDIGCGGGDLAVQLAAWAKEDHLDIHITAADPNASSVAFLESRDLPPNVISRQAFAKDFLEANEQFDIVLSNHVLHHLSAAELNTFLDETSQIALTLALHNDIRRDDLAYAGFIPIGGWYRRSFILQDGLTSIRRSWRPAELATHLPDGWRVETMPLFRNLVIWEP